MSDELHRRRTRQEYEVARRYAADVVDAPSCPWCVADLHPMCRRTIPGNERPCDCRCNHGRT